MHDHPTTFLSLVLWGGYKELRKKVGKTFGADIHNVRWFNWVRASEHDLHSIIDVRPRTLTLCFMGPKRREWGFHTSSGWLHWKDYYRRQRAETALERMIRSTNLGRQQRLVKKLEREGRGADRVA